MGGLIGINAPLKMNAREEKRMPDIRPGRYRHFKGNEYEVIGVARHSETDEWLVVYRPLYGEGGLWARPLAMFLETVTIDGRSIQRFEPVIGS